MTQPVALCAFLEKLHRGKDLSFCLGGWVEKLHRGIDKVDIEELEEIKKLKEQS